MDKKTYKYTWKQYGSVDEFADATQKILLQNKYQNSIILGVLDRLKGKKTDSDIRLVTVSLDGAVVLIGFQTLPHQMLYYFADGKVDEAALKFYVERIIENNWTITQFMGDEKSAPMFADMYAKASGKKAEVTNKLYIYKLGKQTTKESCRVPEGKLRRCSSDDMSFLPYWANALNVERKIGQQNENFTYQFNWINPKIDEYYVFEKGADSEHPWEKPLPVSMAEVKHIDDKCIKISTIYTPPYNRAQGYTTAIIWWICDAYRGKEIILYADELNQSIHGCYDKIGFKKQFGNIQYAFYEISKL